jgi:perosamine synthetase
MDPKKIEAKITSKTKAIIPVHLYGHPCDMDAINDIAKKYKLFVIEDAAEAHGAEYKHRKAGSMSDVSCFSFFGNKIITTGEGGMCLTNNAELAEKIRMFRDHGKNPKITYWHDVIGFNYRMTNLQAAVGVAQLKKIEWFIDIKRRNAQNYNKGLKDLEESIGLVLPSEKPWAKNVYWMYSILMPEDSKLSRDEFIAALDEAGVETRPLFYPLHIMPPYKSKEIFPTAENIARRGINLPSGYNMGELEVMKVCDHIHSILKG